MNMASALIQCVTRTQRGWMSGASGRAIAQQLWTRLAASVDM